MESKGQESSPFIMSSMQQHSSYKFHLFISLQEESQAILDKYLGGYAGLSVANIVIGLIWTTILLINALYTARSVHNVMLERVIHAPLR